ncbi:MAG: sugar transferase [Acidobacteriota bacterium]
MNDARRQLLHEFFKLIDLSIMAIAFLLAAWIASDHKGLLIKPLVKDSLPVERVQAERPDDSSASPAPPPLPNAEAAAEGEAAASGIVGTLESLGKILRPKLVLYLSILVFSWYSFFASRGLYNSRRLESRLLESLDVLRASFLGSLVVTGLAGLVFQEVFKISPDTARMLNGMVRRPLFFPVVFFFLAAGLTLITRLVIRHVLERARLRGRNLRAVLIVGTNHRALRFAESIRAKPQMGYYVEGFVDEEWDGIAGFKKGGHKLVASLKGLGHYLAENVVDEVVVALPVSSAYIYSSRIVSLCQEQGITVRFVSQIFDSRLAKGRLEVFESEPMLSLEASVNEGFGPLAKKILDFSVAAVLLAVLAPLFGLVALAIKILDPGPIFFAQTRIGHNKRRFKLYKFRTMVVDAEARLKELEHLNQVSGPVFKIEKDPRVTPLGEFLRKTSIDELPQLWNVLRGDMSLVGPRPLPERDYQGFDTDAHRRRLSVRPGLTCTWQVSGRNSIPFERWMEMDLEYIDRWSFWLDISLLLRTIPVVLGPLLFFRRGEFMKESSQAKTPAVLASAESSAPPGGSAAARGAPKTAALQAREALQTQAVAGKSGGSP